jgi:hypothetical protein
MKKQLLTSTERGNEMMQSTRFGQLEPGILLVAICTLLIALLSANRASGLTITNTDVDTKLDTGWKPCLRPPAEPQERDRCRVTAYLDPLGVSEIADIFDQSWKAWDNAQPADEKWTLVHGQFLRGTLNITTFQAFNDCPDRGGLTIQARFAPRDGDPTKWYWCQALYDNYDAPLPPHEGSAAARYEMDVMPQRPWTNAPSNALFPPGGSNTWNAPLYPFQYTDSSFYDRPRTWDRDDNTVFFHAVALICGIDYSNRTLTAYEGVSYGFDFRCVSYAVPETGTIQSLLIGIVSLVVWRRKRVS